MGAGRRGAGWCTRLPAGCEPRRQLRCTAAAVREGRLPVLQRASAA
jgi:hypothetical protein